MHSFHYFWFFLSACCLRESLPKESATSAAPPANIYRMSCLGNSRVIVYLIFLGVDNEHVNACFSHFSFVLPFSLSFSFTDRFPCCAMKAPVHTVGCLPQYTLIFWLSLRKTLPQSHPSSKTHFSSSVYMCRCL